MQIGVRAHDFGRTSPEELAARIAGHGFTAVQLAPGKALMGFNPDSFASEQAQGIGEAFAARGIGLAVLGCYINPIHPEPAERERELARFITHLRCAREFGATLVGTETGSVRADCSYDPANSGEEALEELIRSVAELAAEAKKADAYVGIEPAAWHTVSTPARMKRVLDAVGSEHLRVILDPFNLITEENHASLDGMIEECFVLFGDKIAAVHAKDFTLAGGRVRQVPVGQGMLHYTLLLGMIKKNIPDTYVLLESVQPEAAPDCAGYLRRMYEKV